MADKVEVDNIDEAGSGDVADKLQNIYNQLCIWGKNTYGDGGINWMNVLIQAAALAVAVLQSVMQANITALQYEIADAYADLSEDRWKRFKNYYASFERSCVSEATNLDDYDPDYDEALTRASTNVSNAWTTADSYVTDMANRYGLCVDSTLLDDMSFAKSVALTDGANYNYRMEEYWHYYISDRNWNRRSELLNLGRGLQAISATYAQSASDALKSVAELIDSGAQGAMKAFGYFGTVVEGQYPAMFVSSSPVYGQSTSTLGSTITSGGTINI